MRSLLLIGILMLCLSMEGQTHRPLGFELPKNYDRKTAEDYAIHRDTVEMVLKWLCKTPTNQFVEERSKCNLFVMEWLAGSPEVLLDVNTQLLPFSNGKDELLFVFIHGMALYQLQHLGKSNKDKEYLNGYRVVADLAEQSEELSSAENMRPLLKAARRNKLQAYYEELKERSKG